MDTSLSAPVHHSNPLSDRFHRRSSRVKIVFPTVSQLLEYRKLSALAAPDVVALGTLNFGSLEDPDALVVVLAPSPDTEEVRNSSVQVTSTQTRSHHSYGSLRSPTLTSQFDMMIDILNPSDPSLQISQPIVVLNHHMNGFTNLPDPICNWEIVYHLRLLSVQYLAMKDDDITDLEEVSCMCNQPAASASPLKLPQPPFLKSLSWLASFAVPQDAQDPALEAMDDTQEIAPPAISEEEKVRTVKI